MKRICSAIFLGGVACSAHAQSSVSLYGVLDLGLTYVNNTQTGRRGQGLTGGHQFALTDGTSTGVSGSRWGLRGVEDLGGGLKALFVLENGFNANNGALAQGGAEFGRQVYVGLANSGMSNSASVHGLVRHCCLEPHLTIRCGTRSMAMAAPSTCSSILGATTTCRNAPMSTRWLSCSAQAAAIVASISGFSPSATNKQAGFRLALRHRF